MPQRLLVLGAGPAQLGLLRAARERELFVIACDRDPAATGFEFADRRALLSTEDEESLDRLARAEDVDGVIAPGIDWPVAIAARIAEHLALPHPITPETAVLCVSKLRQRERFAEAGVPQPRHAFCGSLDEAAAAAESIGFPCVVKAPDRQGQRGLTLLEDADLLPDAVDVALQASRSRLCIVEELVPGPEVTVNGCSVEGRFHALTVTDRLTAGPPAFGVALAHAWPSRNEARRASAVTGQPAKPASRNEARRASAVTGQPAYHNADGANGSAADAAAAAAEAVGLENGPSYTQIVMGPDGPRVVELAARLGGGHDAELCRLATGVDLNALALAAALGETIDAPEPNPRGGACVRFLVAPEGELVGVDGLADALAVEGVVDARVYRRPGFRFGPLRRGSDRAGFVLAAGTSRGDALARADRAAECVRFLVSDGTDEF